MSRVTKWLAMVGLVAAGAAGGFYWSEARRMPPPSPPAPAGAPAASRPMADEPVEVSLTPEAIARAGIKIAPARSERLAQSTSIPGSVTSNAYRETRVNALVGGVATRVAAELGSRVRRGETLAVIFSAELADAQTKYLTRQAMLEADHQKLLRAQKLAAIGAVSRQDLEEITALHAAHETEVAAARQRLLLLGLGPKEAAELRSAGQIVSEVSVRAPADGVVIARGVNSGQVMSETIDGETIIIHLGTGSYYSLQHAGAAVWSAIERSANETQILEELLLRYDAPPGEVEGALTTLLAELEGESLVVQSANGSSYRPLAEVAPAARGEFLTPKLEKHTDMQDIILLDPVHEVDDRGWPNASEAAAG